MPQSLMNRGFQLERLLGKVTLVPILLFKPHNFCRGKCSPFSVLVLAKLSATKLRRGATNERTTNPNSLLHYKPYSGSFQNAEKQVHVTQKRVIMLPAPIADEAKCQEYQAKMKEERKNSDLLF